MTIPTDTLPKLIPLIREIPTMIFALMVWSELRQIREQLVPVMHRIDERVSACSHDQAKK